MVRLPKAASRVDDAGRGVFTPAETRPLAITNCDNRTVASAFRWRWEPFLGPSISPRQQGFIHGRS
eukprot:11221148-Lingulodinium_polyedra.AAC.1